jgi:dGTPase
MDNPLEIPQDSFNLKEDREVRVKDYIAGMTDRYAIKKFKDIFMPLPWDK